MSAARTIETRLPEVLEELSNPRTPAYYDDILGQVARTRQRPGWTFLERWLPLTTLSTRLATAPRVPMRIAIALLLLLLAFAVTVLIAGTSRPSVPAPFGVAGNGSIVFTDPQGAIKLGNLADGTSGVIVPGTGHAKPVFSPDGRWLAYLQEGKSGNINPDIVVSGPKGETPRVLNTADVGTITHFGWMPDSKAVIAVVGADILAFDLQGTGTPRPVFKGGSAASFNSMNDNLADIFRPPSGDEILFVGIGPDGPGLYRQELAGGTPVAVVTSKTVPSVWTSNQSGAQWSPDGTRIAVSIHTPESPDFGRAYIVNADGTDLHRVGAADIPGSVIDDEHISWSPDGTRIAFARWINGPDGSVDPRPVTIVDVASGAETEASNTEVNGYGGWSWSPDGSSIIEVPGDGSADAGFVIVVDASTGKSRRMSSWTPATDGASDWQRVLPGS
jgi:Tol biopolymer transport system component